MNPNKREALAIVRSSMLVMGRTAVDKMITRLQENADLRFPKSICNTAIEIDNAEKLTEAQGDSLFVIKMWLPQALGLTTEYSTFWVSGEGLPAIHSSEANTYGLGTDGFAFLMYRTYVSDDGRSLNRYCERKMTPELLKDIETYAERRRVLNIATIKMLTEIAGEVL